MRGAAWYGSEEKEWIEEPFPWFGEREIHTFMAFTDWISSISAAHHRMPTDGIDVIKSHAISDRFMKTTDFSSH